MLGWMGCNFFIALIHEHLKVPPEIVVWIDDTFHNNFWIKNNFTEYLKMSCG